MRKLIAATTALMAAGTFAARADVIPVELSVAPTSGGYMWTYSVSLSNDQTIRPGIATSSPVGGTIFDFGPVIGSPTISGPAAGSFNVSVSNTSTPTFGQSPADNPGLSNINYFYNGNGTYTGTGSTGSQLFTVSVESPSSVVGMSQYDGGGSKIATFPAPTGNIGSVKVPVAVPEPGGLAALLTGLLGLGLLRRRHA